MPWDSWDCHNLGAAKNSSMHRTAHRNKELSNPKQQWCEAEKAWFRLIKTALQQPELTPIVLSELHCRGCG